MAYFVKVGAIEENKGGVGARGYELFQQGRSVVARWGSISVTSNRKFHWVYYIEVKSKKFPSEKAAQKEIQKRIRYRIERGYSKLPARVTIRSGLLNRNI